MKNSIFFSLFCLLALNACEKLVLNPVIVPQAPVADEANNVCVKANYYGSSGSPDEGDRCLTTLFTGESASLQVSDMVLALEASGGHKILETGYSRYANAGCIANIKGASQITSDTTYGMLGWVKYDCRPATIVTKTYGPFTYNLVELQKATLSADLISQGFHNRAHCFDRKPEGSRLYLDL